MVITILKSHLLTAMETFTLCFIKKIFLLKKIKPQQKKNEYQFLYKKDEELKDYIITVGNEGNFEHGIDFRNCKTILDRD